MKHPRVTIVRGAAATYSFALFMMFPGEGGAMTKDLRNVEEIFKHTKTLCIGRFLVDVPAAVSLTYGQLWVPYDIGRFPGEAKKVKEHLRNFEDDLESRRYLTAKVLLSPDTMLGKVVDGAVAGQRLFFSLNHGVSSFYTIRSLVPIGDDLFIQSATANRKNYVDVVALLNSTAQRLVPRTETQIPNESGFCIDGAFVRDSAAFDVEKIQLGVRLTSNPDVHFSIEMVRKDYLVESDAIEPRLKEAKRQATLSGVGDLYAKIKTLRQGKRSLGPWNGFEVLARMPAFNGLLGSHDFNFVALGIPKDQMVPTIDMKLDTGVRDNRPGAVKPSITDAEAMYIWDRITNSIRIRPVK
jgi:hypothetical protein